MFLTTPQSLPPRAPGEALATMRDDIIVGLSGAQKSIPCKYLYDSRGSRLFEAITRQPEYYPTRVECDILSRHAAALAAACGGDCTFVEFGCGDNAKADFMLRALKTPRAYLAVDIDVAALTRRLARVHAQFPALTANGWNIDFTAVSALPATAARSPRAGFFPGSTIGNFAPFEACELLRRFHAMLGAGSALIVGVDLVKSVDVLHAAYDDAAGYTAAFNLNLLARCNRELGGTFDLDRFEHDARFVPGRSRVEMHLVSREAHSVEVAGRRFHFDSNESIHTESCHKYTLGEFALLARTAHWSSEQVWLDDAGLFSVHLLRGE